MQNYSCVILSTKIKVYEVKTFLEYWNYTNTLAVMGLGSWCVGLNIWPSGNKIDDPSWMWILLIYLLSIKLFVDADIVL